VIVLGLNAYHGDSSACLLRDGELVAAAEEERFRRVKHWAGFPSQAIAYCLAEAGASIADVDHVAVNQDSTANLGRKLGLVLSSRPDLSLIVDRIRNKRARAGVMEELERAFPGQRIRARLHHVEHHEAHLASAFYASGFEEASAVSVDGFGDFASAAWGMGSARGLSMEGKVFFPHSLGIFYEALTQYLGFPHYGDEYKVMGLAPYGKPACLEQMRRIVRLADDGTFELDLAFFRHHKEKIDYQWSDGSPSVGALYSPALADLLGPARSPSDPLEARHHDIAHSVQAMYEEAFFNLLRATHAAHGTDSITLAGGCAMNSVANGKVYRRSPYRRMYVQPAAGDAGGAVGAAMVVSRAHGGPSGPRPIRTAYWGPRFGREACARALEARREELGAARCGIDVMDDESALCERVAAAIAQGAVVGWFQDRMEWGPRALGNRSILADPRRADMKELLNAKIKRRESFRPFAPSILREAVPAWFEVDDDVPFMTQVYPIRAEKRAAIPAVTHVDGSGRLQTVERDQNPRYYRLIEAFGAATGVPIVLNTSFNESEPVVCTPEQALDCFVRTRMDLLVLGDIVVARAA
jgi:carbamoyltransferase